MQGNKAAAGRHVIEQHFLLVLGDSGCVGVNEKGVVSAELRRIQVRHVLRVLDLDPPSGKHRRDLRIAISRMMKPLVAEEQDREPAEREARLHRRPR